MNFFIKTLGCRVNLAESRELREKLLKKGVQAIFPFRKRGEKPDLIILNSCSVTQKAEKETRQTARSLRREFPQSFLIVTGCAVDFWSKKGKQPDLGANLYLGNQQKMSLSDLAICRSFSSSRSSCQLEPRLFLKIQDGCNNFCAYCLVPYLRGRSRSRPAEEIIEEIKTGEKRGAQEVILCGIDLADYQPSLLALLKLILRQTKIKRIRLGSVNLNIFNDALISLWKNPRFCPHFHIPLQSGCNQILKRMGRKHSFADFQILVEKIQSKIAKANISTDILVGFPGETEKEFKESYQNLASLPLGKIHVFRYSSRRSTRADSMVGQVAGRIKRLRAGKIRRLSQKMRQVFARKFLNRKLKVLLEIKKNVFYQGWSENYLAVRVKGQDLSGRIKVVRIEKEQGGILYGRIEAEQR